MIEAFLRKFLLAYVFPSSFFIFLNTFLYFIYSNKGMMITINMFFAKKIPNFELLILLYIILSSLIAYALFSGNYQLVRLFEGYKFRYAFNIFSFIHRKLRKYASYRLNKLRNKINKVADEIKRDRLYKIEAKLIDKIENNYPTNHLDIMPTKLGNIFRSFEDYPREKYGIETISIWPRLLLVLPSTSHRHIEDAQNSLMFFLVASFLSFIFSVETFFLCLVSFAKNWSSEIFIAIFLISTFIGYFFYRVSLESALNFGNIIKSLFDLYRKILLKELNIPINEPLNKEKRRWQQLSDYFYYKGSKGNPFPEH